MKRGLILTSILLSVFLVASIAIAELTDWEKQVYYDLLESYAFSQRGYDDVCAEVAGRYDISVDTVNSIRDKDYAQEPTTREWEIYDELRNRVESLPGGSESSTDEARKKVFQEVAEKYKLRLGQLYSIEFRCLEWERLQ